MHQGRCINIDDDNPVLMLGDCFPDDIPEDDAVFWKFHMIGNLIGQLMVSYSNNGDQLERCVSQVKK